MFPMLDPLSHSNKNGLCAESLENKMAQHKIYGLLFILFFWLNLWKVDQKEGMENVLKKLGLAVFFKLNSEKNL